jgi:hypothetical protein
MRGHHRLGEGGGGGGGGVFVRHARVGGDAPRIGPVRQGRGPARCPGAPGREVDQNFVFRDTPDAVIIVFLGNHDEVQTLIRSRRFA